MKKLLLVLGVLLMLSGCDSLEYKNAFVLCMDKHNYTPTSEQDSVALITACRAMAMEATGIKPSGGDY